MGSDERRDVGQQRDLFATRDGAERGRNRGDELRYEGPLIDGDDDPVDDDEVETSGSGKAFFTAAIVGGVVILLVGAALWFRSSTDEMISAEEHARLAAATDASSIGSEPALSGHEDVPPPLSIPEPAPEHPTDFRPLPPASDVESTPRLADAEQPAPREPAPLAPSRPAPAEASLRAGSASGSAVRELVEAGRLDEAAEAGQRAMRAAPWSLQVLLACDPANVRRAFQNVPAGPLTLAPAEVDGRACWRLLYGSYPDRDSAVAGIGSVPDYFRQSGTPRPYETR